MLKTSRWMQVIPTLAGLLLALLLVAGAVIWSTGGAGGGEAQLSRLVALAQAARLARSQFSSSSAPPMCSPLM